MRTNVARCVLAVFATVLLSGCYSGGQWNTPNLAFWKSNPFQSTPGATPGSVGSPVKPSGIAAGQGPAAPSVTQGSPGYGAAATASNTPSTSAGYNPPATGYPDTSAGYNAPGAGYSSAQNPSASATSPGAAGAAGSPGYGSPAYNASTAGVPGGRAYGASPSAYWRIERVVRRHFNPVRLALWRHEPLFQPSHAFVQRTRRPAAPTTPPAARREAMRRPARPPAATPIQSGPLRPIPTVRRMARAAEPAATAAMPVALRRQSSLWGRRTKFFRSVGDRSGGVCRRPLRSAQRPLLAAKRRLGAAGGQPLRFAERRAADGRQRRLFATGHQLQPELPAIRRPVRAIPLRHRLGLFRSGYSSGQSAPAIPLRPVRAIPLRAHRATRRRGKPLCPARRRQQRYARLSAGQHQRLRAASGQRNLWRHALVHAPGVLGRYPGQLHPAGQPAREYEKTRQASYSLGMRTGITVRPCLR